MADLYDVTATPTNGDAPDTFRATGFRTEGDQIADQERVFTLEDESERRFRASDYWFDVQDVVE
jgi:hypothetical protein